MAFYLIHAGSDLQKCTPAGVLTTLTLPSGVSLVTTRPARFASLANSIVGVNAFSRNIAINPTSLATRLLTIDGPAAAPSVAAGAAGSLNGAYRFAFTYAIVSGTTVLTESPMSPVAGPTTLTNQQADLSNVTISATTGVNARIIYMTTNGGADYFEAARINNNTATTTTINTSDYDLNLLTAASPKGQPPGKDGTDRLRIITAWKDRLFASPANNPDDVYYSGNREIYAWGAAAKFTVKPQGEDEYGVTAFMARRDELVMAKRRRLWKLVGETPSEYEQIQIAENVGAMVQEGCIVIEDSCYFLGENGFYEYGSSGLVNLSREKVHPWFTTDDYFNRAKSANAFVKYNALYDSIEIHLAAAGSTNIDRWVSYHRKERTWFGPHKTDAFTPTAAGTMDDTNGFSTPVTGSSAGFLYRGNSSTASDDGTAIAFDVTTKWHSGNTPDIEKLFSQMAVLCKVESGGTLSIVPKVGSLEASAQSTISLALTSGRHRTRHLGTGRLMQLRLLNSENNRSVTVYGYELPFHELGRR